MQFSVQQIAGYEGASQGLVGALRIGSFKWFKGVGGEFKGSTLLSGGLLGFRILGLRAVWQRFRGGP